VEEKVAEGGMAVVYRAHDSVLNRKVAVKVMRPELSRDAQYRERFKMEAKAAASLSHPHVASVYDFGEHEGDLFIVMEYLSPRTLKELIAQQGPMPPRAAVEMGVQICDALKYAHANGIIHRDIKPQNVLFTADGRVKVADFGIARVVGPSGGLTAPGEVIGSVYYISPEQARGERATERSDLYSAGAVLYEALTGRVPFEGESAVAVALKHVQEEPRPPRQLNSAIPADLEMVLLRAMRKDPIARYGSAQEMMEDLARVGQGQPAAPRPAPRGPTVMMPRVGEAVVTRAAPAEIAVPSEPIVSPWTWAVLVLTLVVVAGFAGYIWLFHGKALRPQVPAPSVVGLNEREAREQLSAAGLELVVQEREPTEDYPVGTVISQDPSAGSLAQQGDQVYVVVAAPAERVVVPDVLDLPVDRAQALLNEAGLELGEITNEASDTVRAGLVIRQNPPAGKKVSPNAAVALVIASSESAGPETPGSATEPDLTETPSTEEAPSGEETPTPERPRAEPKQKDAQVEVMAQRSSEEEGTDLRDIAVHVTVGDLPHDIRIVVVDQTGERQVHDKRHSKGDSFTVKVQGHGDTTVQVYQDGRLLEEQRR